MGWQTLSSLYALKYKGIMMRRIEYAIALGLLSLSILLKVGSVVALYKLYTHTEELPHDLAYKTEIKRIKIQTDRPIQ